MLWVNVHLVSCWTSRSQTEELRCTLPAYTLTFLSSFISLADPIQFCYAEGGKKKKNIVKNLCCLAVIQKEISSDLWPKTPMDSLMKTS